MDVGALSGIHGPYVEEINIINDTGLLLSYTSAIHAMLGMVEIQRSSTPHHHKFEARQIKSLIAGHSVHIVERTLRLE